MTRRLTVQRAYPPAGKRGLLASAESGFRVLEDSMSEQKPSTVGPWTRGVDGMTPDPESEALACYELDRETETVTWISVESELPDDATDVLISSPADDPGIGWHDVDGWHHYLFGLMNGAVTHWAKKLNGPSRGKS